MAALPEHTVIQRRKIQYMEHHRSGTHSGAAGGVGRVSGVVAWGRESTRGNKINFYKWKRVIFELKKF
jgi:hypothetical protein